MTSLAELVDEHLLVGYERQLRLGALLEEAGDFTVDLHAGTLSFANAGCFRIQVLGTEDRAVGAFVWAWANRVTRLAPDLLTRVTVLQAHGDAIGAGILRDGEHALDQRVTGHHLCLVASGRLGLPAYYAAPESGDTTLFLAFDEPLPSDGDPGPSDLARVVADWAHAPGLFADFRSACGRYFERRGIPHRATEHGWRVEPKSRTPLDLEFDAHGQLTRVGDQPLASAPTSRPAKNRD